MAEIISRENEKINEQFNLTHQGKQNTVLYGVPCEVETWTYKAKESSSEFQYEAKRLACLKRIAELLPKVKLPIMEGIGFDYPCINASALEMTGVDYHDEREVFVIGGHAFFRRYNDDWNGKVMYGSNAFSGKISWGYSSLSLENLQSLELLLKTKTCTTISREDVAEVLK